MSPGLTDFGTQLPLGDPRIVAPCVRTAKSARHPWRVSRPRRILKWLSENSHCHGQLIHILHRREQILKGNAHAEKEGLGEYPRQPQTGPSQASTILHLIRIINGKGQDRSARPQCASRNGGAKGSYLRETTHLSPNIFQNRRRKGITLLP
jgi:hypothetical protein